MSKGSLCQMDTHRAVSWTIGYPPPPVVQSTPLSKAQPPFGPHFFLTEPYLGQGGGYRLSIGLLSNVMLGMRLG